jgi:predicted transcriptional regulator
MNIDEVVEKLKEDPDYIPILDEKIAEISLLIKQMKKSEAFLRDQMHIWTKMEFGVPTHIQEVFADALKDIYFVRLATEVANEDAIEVLEKLGNREQSK